MAQGTTCSTKDCKGEALQKFKKDQPVCSKCYAEAFEAYKRKKGLRYLELLEPGAEGTPRNIGCTVNNMTLTSNIRPDELKSHKHGQGAMLEAATAKAPAAPAEVTGAIQPRQHGTLVQGMLLQSGFPVINDISFLRAPSQKIHTVKALVLPRTAIMMRIADRRASEQLGRETVPELYHGAFLEAVGRLRWMWWQDGWTLRSSEKFDVLPESDDSDGFFELHLADLGDGNVFVCIPARLRQRVYKVYGNEQDATAVLKADGFVKPYRVDFHLILVGFNSAIADFHTASWERTLLLNYRTFDPDLNEGATRGQSRHLEEGLGLAPRDDSGVSFANMVRQLSSLVEHMRRPEVRWFYETGAAHATQSRGVAAGGTAAAAAVAATDLAFGVGAPAGAAGGGRSGRCGSRNAATERGVWAPCTAASAASAANHSGGVCAADARVARGDGGTNGGRNGGVASPAAGPRPRPVAAASGSQRPAMTAAADGYVRADLRGMRRPRLGRPRGPATRPRLEVQRTPAAARRYNTRKRRTGVWCSV